MTRLREDLLRGTVVAVSGGVGAAVREALRELGARLEELDEHLDDSDAEAWAAARAPLHALLFDARPAFGGRGADVLGVALEQCWAAVRAVAVGALIESQDTAKILMLAPAPGAGRHAEAARSALENLARTLSVEWARYGVRTTAVLPGDQTTDEQLGELVCFLLSPAGDYFSGCRLELGEVPLRGAQP
jgi:NAD(P)-dependent dehydrogenase (short-subunit alcohol dehydrogenase family)